MTKERAVKQLEANPKCSCPTCDEARSVLQITASNEIDPLIEAVLFLLAECGASKPELVERIKAEYFGFESRPQPRRSADV